MVTRNQKYQCFFVLVFFVFLCTTGISAQEKIKVHASGTSISRDITIKEALKEAIIDAQTNAYKKAGITEHVSVATILFEESSGDEVKKYFSDISTIESNASIIVDSIYPEKRSFDESGNMVISVKIDATVFKYNKKKDPAFFFNIEGLKDTYYENEFISFSFTPSQDGYLKIFVIDNMEAIMLYPFKSPIAEYLSDEKYRLFRKGETVNFPIDPAYKPGYSIELDADKETEINNLFFVYIKKDIPWIESNVSIRKILLWIYNIPIDQRSIKFQSVTIRNIK